MSLSVAWSQKDLGCISSTSCVQRLTPATVIVCSHAPGPVHFSRCSHSNRVYHISLTVARIAQIIQVLDKGINFMLFDELQQCVTSASTASRVKGCSQVLAVTVMLFACEQGCEHRKKPKAHHSLVAGHVSRPRPMAHPLGRPRCD